METELTLSIGGFPPFSARGCVQELTPLSSGEFRRTISGDLIHVGKKNQKYKTIIKCRDKSVLATEGLSLGTVVQVGCLQYLWQKTSQTTVTLERVPVGGSVTAVDETRVPIKILSIKGQEITLEKSGYVGYRPFLNMCVTRFSLVTDEWGMSCGWSLEAEEV